MNYAKTGAALASALSRVTEPSERALPVFIRADREPTPDEATVLEEIVGGVAEGRRVFTATLSAQEVERLSEQPWVRSLELSRPMRLLDSG
ncbi:MAG: hypothetical protein ACRDSJ_19690 [Rubrobacteraceae bacterium]